MNLIKNTIDTFFLRGPDVAIRAIANHIVGILWRAFGNRFISKSIYQYRMLLDLEDRGISRTLLLFGERELEHKKMLELVVKPGMTILDIGANIGYYALMELDLIGPTGNLVAVEPSPSNVELLRRNLALNGYSGVEVHQAAISDQTGVKLFHLSEMSNLNTFHDNGTGLLHLSGKTLEVKVTTVPEIMGGRPLDLIRMDVEGHEVEVINGLLPAIESGDTSPMIIFETHLSRYTDDHSFEVSLRRLFNAGYRVKLVGSSYERGTEIIEDYGYDRIGSIRTDGVERAIFEDIAHEDAINMICREGGIRTVLVSK